MLDIKRIKADPDGVREALLGRQKDYGEEINEVLALDEQRRELIFDTEQRKAKQNEVSKLIPQYKKEGKPTDEIMAEMRELSEGIKADGAKLAEIEEKLDAVIKKIPNVPNEKVKVGKDDSDNVEIRKWGEPRKFDFEPKAHWDIGKDLDILDPDTAAKVTGARFHFYKGLGARLERAIISFFMDYHSENNGYTEILPPYTPWAALPHGGHR